MARWYSFNRYKHWANVRTSEGFESDRSTTLSAMNSADFSSCRSIRSWITDRRWSRLIGHGGVCDGSLLMDIVNTLKLRSEGSRCKKDKKWNQGTICFEMNQGIVTSFWVHFAATVSSLWIEGFESTFSCYFTLVLIVNQCWLNFTLIKILIIQSSKLRHCKINGKERGEETGRDECRKVVIKNGNRGSWDREKSLGVARCIPETSREHGRKVPSRGAYPRSMVPCSPGAGALYPFLNPILPLLQVHSWTRSLGHSFPFPGREFVVWKRWTIHRSPCSLSLSFFLLPSFRAVSFLSLPLCSLLIPVRSLRFHTSKEQGRKHTSCCKAKIPIEISRKKASEEETYNKTPHRSHLSNYNWLIN